MSWWKRLFERWAWKPPQKEVEAREEEAEELHQAAIDARVSFERSAEKTRPFIRRVERLAEAYAREEKAHQ